MYRQRSAADAGVDVLHVFGRTYNQPHIYFHRALDNEVWSPWTKVDLDIQGNHLIPVVHNRRLHVFWPVFTEKPNNAKSSGSSDSHFEVQLAWSEYKQGRWLAKRLSAPVFDGAWGLRDPAAGAEVYVFDAGEVDSTLKVQLRWVGPDSTSVFGLSFEFSARPGLPITKTIPTLVGEQLVTPASTEVKYMEFVAEGSATGLTLTLAGGSAAPVLRKMPSVFHVLPSHQLDDVADQRSFFYQDATRTFLARYLGSVGGGIVVNPKKVNLATVSLANVYLPASLRIPSAVDPPRKTMSLVDVESIAARGAGRGFGGDNA